MRKRIQQILIAETGFSMVELLATVVIVTLASAILAVGIPTATQTYRKVVDNSNAQVLLSTTLMRMRSELAYATQLSVDTSTNTITYINGRTNKPMSLTRTDKGKLIVDYVDDSSDDDKENVLVQPEGGRSDMYVTFDSVSLHVSTDGHQIVKFGKLQTVVEDKSTGAVSALLELDDYEVRIIKIED